MGLDKVVSRGDPLAIEAADWNDHNRAVREVLHGGRPRPESATELPYPSAVALVRNDSGVALTRFAAVGLGNPVIFPDENLAEFKRQPTFAVVKPVAGTHEGKTGILLEPLAAGKIGACLVSGVCPVRLTGADVGFAEITNGQTYLTANASGKVQILWPEAGTGERWAYARLGGGGAGGTGTSLNTEYDDATGSVNPTNVLEFAKTDFTLTSLGGGAQKVALKNTFLFLDTNSDWVFSYPVVLSAGTPVYLRGGEYWDYATLSTWSADPGVASLVGSTMQRHVLRASATLPVNLTGFTPGVDPITLTGTGPEVVVLFNVSGTYADAITLKHDDAGAGASKFLLPGQADLPLYGNDGVMLWYDTVQSAWLVAGKVGFLVEKDDGTSQATSCTTLKFKASDFTVTTLDPDTATVGLVNAGAAVCSIVSKNANQALTAGALTTLTWQTVAYESPSGFYASGSNGFVVPTGQGGTYLVTLGVLLTGFARSVEYLIEIVLAGTGAVAAQIHNIPASGLGSIPLTCSVVLRLAAGDTLTAGVSNTAGAGAGNASSDPQTFFSVARIGT